MSRDSEPAILLVDAGSTRFKWALHQGRRISVGGSAPHQGDPAAIVTEIPIRMTPSRVLVASVQTESADQRLGDVLRDRFGVGPEFARSGPFCCGVTNAYEVPDRLGVDRWLAMIAAHVRNPAPQVVVDCGTAVTIDLVDGAGRHLGGQIIPGIHSMHRCLTAHTRLQIGLGRPTGLLGRDTATCVASGIHHAVAALIDRVAEEAASGGAPAAVIMSGGDAEAVAALVRAPREVRPHLVLEGLVLWAGLDIDR